MCLNIKNAETHQLVQELAELTGETQTMAVTIAVRGLASRGCGICARPGWLTGCWPSAGIPHLLASRYFPYCRHGRLAFDQLGLPGVTTDTSALIAILRAEDDASEMALCHREGKRPGGISAASYLETAVVIDASRDPDRQPPLRRTGRHRRTTRRTGDARPGSYCPGRIPRFREGQRPQGRPELRGLLRLRLVEVHRRSTAVQGKRLQPTPTSHPHCPLRRRIILADSDAEGRPVSATGRPGRRESDPFWAVLVRCGMRPADAGWSGFPRCACPR